MGLREHSAAIFATFSEFIRDIQHHRLEVSMLQNIYNIIIIIVSS